MSNSLPKNIERTFFQSSLFIVQSAVPRVKFSFIRGWRYIPLPSVRQHIPCRHIGFKQIYLSVPEIGRAIPPTPFFEEKKEKHNFGWIATLSSQVIR